MKGRSRKRGNLTNVIFRIDRVKVLFQKAPYVKKTQHVFNPASNAFKPDQHPRSVLRLPITKASLNIVALGDKGNKSDSTALIQVR